MPNVSKLAALLAALTLFGCESASQVSGTTAQNGAGPSRPAHNTIISSTLRARQPTRQVAASKPATTTSGSQDEPERAYVLSYNAAEAPTSGMPTDAKSSDRNNLEEPSAPLQTDLGLRASLDAALTGHVERSGSQNPPPISAVEIGPQPIRAAIAGNRCDCPYDLDLNGALCLGRSTWAKAEKFYPVCYADPWGTTTLLADRVLHRIGSAS